MICRHDATKCTLRHRILQTNWTTWWKWQVSQARLQVVIEALALQRDYIRRVWLRRALAARHSTLVEVFWWCELRASVFINAYWKHQNVTILLMLTFLMQKCMLTHKLTSKASQDEFVMRHLKVRVQNVFGESPIVVVWWKYFQPTSLLFFANKPLWERWDLYLYSSDSRPRYRYVTAN